MISDAPLVFAADGVSLPPGYLAPFNTMLRKGQYGKRTTIQSNVLRPITSSFDIAPNFNGQMRLPPTKVTSENRQMRMMPFNMIPGNFQQNVYSPLKKNTYGLMQPPSFMNMAGLIHNGNMKKYGSSTISPWLNNPNGWHKKKWGTYKMSNMYSTWW